VLCEKAAARHGVDPSVHRVQPALVDPVLDPTPANGKL
jgi:hypothetical protein